MEALTARQAEVLEFIADFIKTMGYSPSYQEIGDHFGFSSKAGAKGHVDALIRKGRVRHMPGISRSISVIAPHLGRCSDDGKRDDSKKS